MTQIASQSLIDQEYMLSRKFGTGPDLSIHTGAMFPVAVKDLPAGDADKPILSMRGSSTIQDLQKDTMMYSALQSMREVPADLTLWLNHTYDVPDSAMGRLYGRPDIQIVQNGIADLWISEETFTRNPPAKRTHDLISLDKARFGCSVGCEVVEWSFKNADDPYSPILIHKVSVLEWSVVGIPANQRCWVENAIKGLFANSLARGDGDTALKLAPAFKGLYATVFRSAVEHITSEGLAKDLQRVRPRTSPQQRIMFSFEHDGFYLDNAGVKKSLTREETSDLLEQSPPELDKADDIDADENLETKSASGKTSWPLMSLGTEWTGSKAEKQIFDWARNEQDEIVASKARQCFLYYNPGDSDRQSGYKMPFCYVSDGSPKIVPLGVRACAGVLSGGMGGVSASAEDKDGMKAKVKTMYGRINRELHPDPEWEVPWEKKESEKEIDPDVAKEIADSESDAPLNRQDLGEVNADGTHAPMTGKHAHRHTNGQGGDHDHEHEHQGDADHGHSHVEKHFHPHIQSIDDGEVIDTTKPEFAQNFKGFINTPKASTQVGCGCCDTCTGKSGCTCCDKCATRKAIDLDEDGNHAPYTGTHTHAHKAFGADDANESGKHSHEHEHQGDSAHKHPHASEKSLIPPTPEQMALLGVYNNIGKQLGFPEHTLTTKCDLVQSQGDAGIVRSTLSALDDCSDAMMAMAQRCDGYVDALMGMLGVPDVNDNEETASPMPLALLSSQRPDLLKEGRELSDKNRGHLQHIHDTVTAMHPGVCKGVTGDGTSHQDGSMTVEEAQAEARQMGQGDSYSNLSSMLAQTTKAVLLKAFDGLEAKSLVEGVVQKAVDMALADARANLEILQREQTVLMQHISKLAHMPLPRPTNLQRSVTPVSPHALDNVVSYEEMLAVAGIESSKSVNLNDLEAMTQVVSKTIHTVNGEIPTKMRYWPAGVGKGIRPPLTASQKVLMHASDWGKYREASDEVFVPIVDDPFGL